MNDPQNNICTVWKSFFITTIIQLIPYPIHLSYLPKPSWLSLLLIYWVTKIPQRINIGSGFILGLIIDILSGPIIGVRAVLLSSITYLLIIKLSIFCNLPTWKQGLIIILFSLNIQLIIYLTYIIIIGIMKFKLEIFLNYILLNSVIDGILWIGVCLIMLKTDTRKKIRNQH